jgi:hypothetical protein
MLAMFNPLSMPRASWKARLFFVALAAMTIGLTVQQWPHRHDALAIARWIAWFLIASCIFYLPQMLVVVILGRLPKVCRGGLGGLNRTLPQIHVDIARKQRELHRRSRKF